MGERERRGRRDGEVDREMSDREKDRTPGGWARWGTPCLVIKKCEKTMRGERENV